MDKKKILVVDDSEVALMSEVMILQREGDYEILRARDGEQAVDVATQERPDLVVLDVIMPHMHGFEACRALKGNPETSSIPILMATTRGEPENIELGYESGCNDYITKPVDAVQFIRKVEDLLD